MDRLCAGRSAGWGSLFLSLIPCSARIFGPWYSPPPRPAPARARGGNTDTGPCRPQNIDDGTNFGKNEHLQAGLTRDSLSWAIFDGTLIGVYEPVAWMVKMAVVSAFGGSAKVFAYFFATMHVLSSSLLYVVLCRFSRLWTAVRPGDDLILWHTTLPFAHIALPFAHIAFWVAVMYGLHPMRVETVRWLSAGGYSVANVFMLISLLAHSEFIVTRRRLFQLLGLVLYALAVGSKSNTVTAAVVHLVLGLLWGLSTAKRDALRAARSKSLSISFRFKRLVATALMDAVPLSMVAVLGLAMALSAASSGPDFDNLGQVAERHCNIDLTPRLVRASVHVWTAIRLTVVPVGLTNRYPMPLDFDPAAMVRGGCFSNLRITIDVHIVTPGLRSGLSEVRGCCARCYCSLGIASLVRILLSDVSHCKYHD